MPIFAYPTPVISPFNAEHIHPSDIQTIRDVLRNASAFDFTPVMTQEVGARVPVRLEDGQEEEQLILRFKLSGDLIVHFDSQDGDAEGWVRFRAGPDVRDTVAEGSKFGRFTRVIDGFID